MVLKLFKDLCGVPGFLVDFDSEDPLKSEEFLFPVPLRRKQELFNKKVLLFLDWDLLGVFSLS